ncbi:hypothetical protein [Lactobacillus crispatus]|uniref:hypothetical protein n=1 Tax=Lactobacillus crispatus TaxID=47770 RepID=UPI000E011755|nr:hypothetical protein [Lactobacillus crispatus]STX18483.1 Uncharacterised protein [Lactobacillus acidophilus]MCT7731635.1 hypothetical protein [Lactobacillus crispatus]MCT7871323.1 hypothetical protein [Lactobacillus crispatus]MCT7879654.1 hypothetical protein [Lactobacillus crispatus]NJJ53691.1 hypothetical protein [Lactobacillus crispatus]
MITLQNAMNLTNQEEKKNSAKFKKELNKVTNDVTNFLDVKLIDKYLNNLVKKNAITGEAEYKLEDFLKENHLNAAWCDKRKELLQDCPVFTKFNDPTDTLRQNFYFECQKILKHYGYVGEALDVYSHTFNWLVDAKEPKSALAKFIAHRHEEQQWEYRMADRKRKFDKEQKDKEETRRMTKFAKILAKELR